MGRPDNFLENKMNPQTPRERLAYEHGIEYAQNGMAQRENPYSDEELQGWFLWGLTDGLKQLKQESK